MLHPLFSLCMQRQFCISQPADMQLVFVINHESRDFSLSLNGYKFIWVECMSTWLDGVFLPQHMEEKNCLCKCELWSTQSLCLILLQPISLPERIVLTHFHLSICFKWSNLTYIPEGIFSIWSIPQPAYSQINTSTSARTTSHYSDH